MSGYEDKPVSMMCSSCTCYREIVQKRQKADEQLRAGAHLDGEGDLVCSSAGGGEQAGAHIRVTQGLCSRQGCQILEVGVPDGPAYELAALLGPPLSHQRIVMLLPGQDVVPPARPCCTHVPCQDAAFLQGRSGSALQGLAGTFSSISPPITNMVPSAQPCGACS